jgi:hypothetical protein
LTNYSFMPTCFTKWLNMAYFKRLK